MRYRMPIINRIHLVSHHTDNTPSYHRTSSSSSSLVPHQNRLVSRLGSKRAATALSVNESARYVNAAQPIDTTNGMAASDRRGTNSSTAQSRTNDIAEPSN